MILNLIWDVDGALCDTYPAVINACSRALKDFNRAAPMDRISRLARVSREHCLHSLAQENGLAEDTLAERFDSDYARIGLEYQKPFAGVREICAYIQNRGGVNVLATQRTLDSTRRLLEVHDLSGWFVDIAAAQYNAADQPDVQRIAVLLQRNRLEPAQTLAIGARAAFAAGAQAAGVRACLFRAPRRDFQADLLVTDYTRLMRLIKQENGTIEEANQL